MTKLDSWVRADKEGEGGVGGGVPHEVGFVVNLFILSFIFYLLYRGLETFLYHNHADGDQIHDDLIQSSQSSI